MHTNSCELFNNLSQHYQQAWPEDGGEVLENVVHHIWKTSTQENLHYSKNVVEEMDAKTAFAGFPTLPNWKKDNICPPPKFSCLWNVI